MAGGPDRFDDELTQENTGLRSGLYTAFLDLTMGITHLIAGSIVGTFGYPTIFLYGSGAAGCASVLTLLRCHLVPACWASIVSRQSAISPTRYPSSERVAGIAATIRFEQRPNKRLLRRQVPASSAASRDPRPSVRRRHTAFERELSLASFSMP
jgi:hypothetical protein